MSHISAKKHSARAFNNALYLLGGVRGVETATVMFAKHPDGSEKAAPMELVRLVFPRRVYIQSHVDYLAEIIISAYKIVESPEVLRHLSAKLEAIQQ